MTNESQSVLKNHDTVIVGGAATRIVICTTETETDRQTYVVRWLHHLKMLLTVVPPVCVVKYSTTKSPEHRQTTQYFQTQQRKSC